VELSRLIRVKALFFSRGRGMGHAIPDMALAAALPGIDWVFASYSTGLKTLRAAGLQCYDLGIADGGDIHDSAAAAIQTICPDVVVSHEEPFVCRLHPKVIYVASWLYPQNTHEARATMAASKTLIWCDLGLFPALPNTEFTGPLVRLKRPVGTEQLTAKPTITVITGGHATEKRVPLVDLVTRALDLLPERQMLWIGSAGLVVHPRVRTLPFQPDLASVICASNLVITAGNRGSTCDAAYLGVPTLSLSPQTNPMDDLSTMRLRSNTWLSLKATTPEILAYWIQRLLDDPPHCERVEPTVGEIAKRLGEVIEEITRK
jgi:UDP:flavonoid glycosyltransferase YjiC (YdhE family)